MSLSFFVSISANLRDCSHCDRHDRHFFQKDLKDGSKRQRRQWDKKEVRDQVKEFDIRNCSYCGEQLRHNKDEFCSDQCRRYWYDEQFWDALDRAEEDKALREYGEWLHREYLNDTH